MRRWTEAAEQQARRQGSAVLWLVGNNVYSKMTLLPGFSDQSLEEVAERIVLGPLARPSGNLTGQKWEVTAAFHLERRLRHHLPAGVQFTPLGRRADN